MKRRNSYTDRSVKMVLKGCTYLNTLTLTDNHILTGDWSTRSTSSSSASTSISTSTSSSSSDEYVFYKNMERMILKRCSLLNPFFISEFIHLNCPSLKHIEMEHCLKRPSFDRTPSFDPPFDQTALLKRMPCYSTFVGNDIGVGPLPYKYRLQDIFFKKHSLLMISVLKVQRIIRGALVRSHISAQHQVRKDYFANMLKMPTSLYKSSQLIYITKVHI